MNRPGTRTLVACLALVALGAAGPLAAQGVDGKPDLVSPAAAYPRSVGVFGASWIEGGGLSYQIWLGRLGLGITAGGMASPSGGSIDSWSYNAQVDLLYKLFSSNIWSWLSGDLFAFASAGHWAEGYGASYSPSFSLALGIGYEIVLFRHFSVPLHFGYAASWPLAVDFCFGGGLRYRF